MLLERIPDFAGRNLGAFASLVRIAPASFSVPLSRLSEILSCRIQQQKLLLVGTSRREVTGVSVWGGTSALLLPPKGAFHMSPTPPACTGLFGNGIRRLRCRPARPGSVGS
jgi:hypothetical protein